MSIRILTSSSGSTCTSSPGPGRASRGPRSGSISLLVANRRLPCKAALLWFRKAAPPMRDKR
jgi:hypothetical protein